MKSIVDFSGTIENKMWGYHEIPGAENIIPKVRVEPVSFVKENGYFTSKITITSNSGTYIEAGSHILENGKNIDEYPLQRFIRPVKIVKLPRQTENF